MSLRDLIVQWNNKFPNDRVWREKHNVSFNSEQHRKQTQLDILFDMMESKLIQNLRNDAIEEEENKKLIAEGKFLKQRKDERAARLFSQISLSQLNDTINFNEED